MSLILYINGQVADLDPGTTIAQTRQVNDLNSLDNRQASYTNKFSLPKTAANQRIVQYLSLVGNNSNVPYQKNECSLYSASGECFVYNGWAMITDGGDSFDVVIYDGIIDLYKAIENQNLSVLDLSDLNHTKTMQAVRDSWTDPELPYRYILADYNGKTGSNSAGTSVAIDYLVPSVNVAWLWDKVFSYYGFSYSGSVFNTQYFKNLWMTFPKGIDGESSSGDVFGSSAITNENSATSGSTWSTLLLKFNESESVNTEYIEYLSSAKYRIKVKKTGYYNLRIAGNVKSTSNFSMYVVKNVSNTSATTLNALSPIATIKTNQVKDTDFDYTSSSVLLSAGDSISVIFRHVNGVNQGLGFSTADKWENLEVTVRQLQQGEINFSNAFTDFSIRDFLSEVVHRFGLTMQKDKYSNSYTFYNLAEIMQNPDVENWSSKFISKKQENYVYGSYAQQNWFRYAYNDKESSHNDACIPVENVNLAESRDAIKSKIYSPELNRTPYLNRTSGVYKLWEKEVSEDSDGVSTVKYKALDKRYYFLRAEQYTESVTIRDLTIGGSIPTAYSYAESYWKLPFTDILQDYYSDLNRILDKACIITAELWLNEGDIAQLDFLKLYYIEQLGSYYLLNKINNYTPGKPTTCELVKVIFGETQQLTREISITQVSSTTNNTTHRYNVSLTYTTSYNPAALGLQWREINTEEWNTLPVEQITQFTSPFSFYLPIAEFNGLVCEIRIVDAFYNVLSNVEIIGFILIEFS
ncbi:hypothetical protein ACLI1A_13355 [Flavobacterium sp. RHBU_3]|uniref:hypothetical protein n=1 Tax=Flavobacterium sp. RHBU_3 TaxID=3391184 RepID=UPI00398472A5